PAYPDSVQDVELRVAERRGALVLDDLDAGPAPDRLGSVLESFNPADVQPHRSVELEGLAARRRLGRPEEDADLLPKLVDEDRGGLGLAQRTGDLAEGLRHEPGLQADVAVA